MDWAVFPVRRKSGKIACGHADDSNALARHNSISPRARRRDFIAAATGEAAVSRYFRRVIFNQKMCVQMGDEFTAFAGQVKQFQAFRNERIH